MESVDFVKASYRKKVNTKIRINNLGNGIVLVGFFLLSTSQSNLHKTRGRSNIIFVLFICFHLTNILENKNSASYLLVYDRNLVSVSATKTKIKFRYRYWSLNFFCLNQNFLHLLFLKFFSCFLCLVLNISHVIQSYHVKLFV